MNEYKFLTLDSGNSVSRETLYETLRSNGHSNESSIEWVNKYMIVAFGYCYLGTSMDWVNDLFRKLLHDEYKFRNGQLRKTYWI